MLLQIGPLLRLGPNVITDGTFITLGSSYYTCVFYIQNPLQNITLAFIVAPPAILILGHLVTTAAWSVAGGNTLWLQSGTKVVDTLV